MNDAYDMNDTCDMNDALVAAIRMNIHACVYGTRPPTEWQTGRVNTSFIPLRQLAAEEWKHLSQSKRKAIIKRALKEEMPAEASSKALSDALAELSSNRLVPLEELAKGTSKRLAEHEAAVEVQFLEAAEASGQKLDERAVAIEEHVTQHHERLEELNQKIEDVKKSRLSPPPAVGAAIIPPPPVSSTGCSSQTTVSSIPLSQTRRVAGSLCS